MDYILDNVGIWKDRLVNNSIQSFEEMTVQRWIRIIIIVGAYLLVRPYLVKGAANQQKKQMQKEADELGLGADTAPNANDFRGGKKGAKKAAAAAAGSADPTARQRKAAESD